MTLFIACCLGGLTILGSIGFLAYKISEASSPEPWEREAEDAEQMAALMELRAYEAMEHDLFATK